MEVTVPVRKAHVPALLLIVLCAAGLLATAGARDSPWLLAAILAAVAVAVPSGHTRRPGPGAMGARDRFAQALLQFVAELRQETTLAGVLRRGCERAATLLRAESIVVLQSSSARQAPELLHAFLPAHLTLEPPCSLCEADAAAAARPSICSLLATLAPGKAHRYILQNGNGACPLVRRLGARETLLVPLPSPRGDPTWAVVAVPAGRARFSEAARRKAELVCGHLGYAMQTTLAFEAQRQDVEVANALLSVAHLVTTEREVGSVLQTLAEVTANVLGHSGVWTFLWDLGSFTGAAQAGLLSAEAAGACAPGFGAGDDALADALLARKEPLLIEDPAASELLPTALAGQLGQGALLACPMISRQSELLGAMLVRHHDPGHGFTPRDAAVAFGIARLGALAVEHARLQEDTLRSERMKALGEMSAGVAHDLNNLLAGILGHAQLATLGIDDREVVLNALNTIVHACTEGGAMVRRIQSLSGRPHPAPTDLIDCADLAREALQLARPQWLEQARQATGSLHMVLELEEGVWVRGVRPELREAVAGLITNAVEAMPHGGRLMMRCTRREPWAVLEVADTGVGMDESVRRRVFDPFFTTKVARGHGLGLSVTYGIVQQHLGTISVESAPQQGATFTLRLPLATHPAPATPLPPPAPLPPLRVLVVDDEAMVAESLAAILRRLGHTVDTASGGAQALACWEDACYDLLVADHSMPGISGLELAQRLRERHPCLPVLLITGWDTPVRDSADLQKVADAVLPKPVGYDDLLRAMASVIARRNSSATPSARVMVVEDDRVISSVIQGVLTDASYTVECFRDGESALDRLEELRPDILITDCHLEGLSGIEVARRVKERLPATPVILVTGWLPPPDELAAVDFCLDKPFNIADLVATVEQARHHHRQ